MPIHCNVVVHELMNKPLSQHVWNLDGSKLAVCPNSEEIIIFKNNGSKWIVEDILKEHDQLITGLDWCKKTDKIITCSMDRNAYVWACDGQEKWRPTLATLRFSKGASCIAWNPEGTKFAAGASDGAIVVGHFESENDWWLCKHLKVETKHTITTVNWHPNGIDLVIGSIDGSVSVVSGYVKAVDKDTPADHSFTYIEKCTSAVLYASFSPKGSCLAFLTYEGNLVVVDETSKKTSTIFLGDLPMTKLKFLSENLILTTGHKYAPTMVGLAKSSGKWEKMDDLVPMNSEGKASSSSAFGSAFAKFKSMDDCGLKAENTTRSHKLGHVNTISNIDLQFDPKEVVNGISTSSLDGKLVCWDLKTVLSGQELSKMSI